ncbi:MAG: hypothetical protein ACE5EG_01835 [Thermoanaerobaculia bacterium]
MGTFTANPVARSWLLAALAATTLAPGPWAAAGLLLLALLWLATRPRRASALMIGAAVVLALGLLVGELLMRPGPAGSADRLAERARRGYGAIWAELDRLAVGAARELGDPSDDDTGRLQAFEALSRVLAEAGRDDLTLQLANPNGSARAWAGPGLLHEPRASDLARGPRSHIAGFSAVTLLRVVNLSEEERPWRAVRGATSRASAP